MAGQQLFRTVALARLASPEQLDQLITITTPAGWVSLLGIGIFLVATLLWGIYGSIPEQVQGQGILLAQGGVVGIQAQSSGRIAKINFEVGDIVEEGQILARIAQDDLLAKIKQAETDLKNLESSFNEKKKTETETGKIQVEKLKQDKINQNQQIKNLEIQLAAQQSFKKQQQEIRDGYQKLASQGIISKGKVFEAENEIVKIDQNINSITLEIERAKNQLNAIQVESKKIEGTGAIDELTHEQQVEQAKLQLKALQAQFVETSQIVSPYTGKVLEVPKKENDLVSAGTTVFVMEQRGGTSDFEVHVYFPPLTGKQVQKGMKAQIAPSIVKREEYGFLEGTISTVERYPSSFAAIIKTVQNESLAQMLAASGAPIKAVATLIPNKNTITGYQWSSRNGPPIKLDRGTICFVTVTVREQAPIALVIPLFKKYIFGEGTVEEKLMNAATKGK
jgi:HlyD family secretion protein